MTEDLRVVEPYMFPRPDGPPPHCNCCGRFLRWDEFHGDWQCVKAYKLCDADGGGWEHD